MRFSLLASVASALTMATTAMASGGEVVLYWGQASAGSQKSLGEYCDAGYGDIFVVSFIDQFGTSGPVSLNLGGNATPEQTGKDIQHCQSLGKKVLISIGGATATGILSDDSMGQDVADQLWNTFGGGSGSNRPLGDAVVDGFDLDIESGNSNGWGALVTQLKSHYSSDSSKQYYVSAAPQCVYPDASVGKALDSSDIDYAWIQFYNNPCAVDKQFNWDQWQDFATSTAYNKNIKLFLGLPGSASAAGSGYVDYSVIEQTVANISSSANYGGVMFWDASQAYSNQVNGNSLAGSVQELVGGGGSSPAPSGSPSAPASSAPAPSASGAPVSSAPAAPGAPSAPAGASSAPGAPSGAPVSSAPAGAPVSSAPVSSAPAGAPAGAPSGAPVSSAPAGAPSGAPVSSAPAGAPSGAPSAAPSGVPSGAPSAPASSDPVAATTSSIISTTTTTIPTSGASSAPATSAPAPAATTGVANLGVQGGGGVGKIVKPDEADGNCKGKTGQDLADCINSQGSGASSSSAAVTSGQAPTSAAAASSAAPAASSAAASGSCTEGAAQCQDGKYAVCNYGQWVQFQCAAGTTCQATAQGQDAWVGCNFTPAASSAAIVSPSSAPQRKREYRFRGHVH